MLSFGVRWINLRLLALSLRYGRLLIRTLALQTSVH